VAGRYHRRVQTLLLIAGAGALGALSRYGATLWAMRAFGDRLPYGTLIVNVLGCLLLGFLLQAGVQHPGLSRETRLALGTGFLGSFTTFSTFGVQTVRLMERGAWGSALLNVALNVVVGIGCAWLGVLAAKRFVG
jgi:CrcB protein